MLGLTSKIDDVRSHRPFCPRVRGGGPQQPQLAFLLRCELAWGMRRKQLVLLGGVNRKPEPYHKYRSID